MISMPTLSSARPTGTAAAEQPQQQQAGRHRRQHQRQRHQRLEQRLAGKIAARQHPADADRRRQHQQRRNRRHQHGEPRDRPGLGTHRRVIGAAEATAIEHRARRGPFQELQEALRFDLGRPGNHRCRIDDVEIRMILLRDVRDHAHPGRHRVGAIDDAGVDAFGLDRRQHRAHGRKWHDLRGHPRPRLLVFEPPAAVDTGGHRAGLAHRQAGDVALRASAPA